MECRKINRELRKKESPTDQDFNQAIDVCLEVHMKEAELEKNITLNSGRFFRQKSFTDIRMRK